MKHLLVIEDDKVDQMAFERFTKKHDFPYTYHVVNSIKEAKKALKNNTYDAVVSDYFLGDGTTFEILDLNLNIPIVVVTGTGSEEIAVNALKKGAFDYLIKDVDGYYLKTLVITVKNAIDRFNNEKELKKYHQKLEELVEERTNELQVSEQNLQNAQQIAQIGSFNLDLKTNLGMCSNTFFDVTELEKTKELKFSEWRKLIHPNDVETNNEVLKKAIEKGSKYHHEFRIITKNTKTLKWMEGIGEVNVVNQTFKGVIQNITKRKKAEQIQKVLFHISNAVIQSENLYQLITIIKEKLGTIINTNSFYIALHNKETNTISLPFFKDEKDSFKEIPAGNTLTDYIIKAKKSLLISKEELVALVKKNNIQLLGTMPEIWLGVPLVIDKNPIGIIAVQNYTNKNAYTEKDKDLLEFVSEQISISIHRKKIVENLKIALKKATESDRLKTAFLHNISHEIRTPMNGILGFTDLLKNPELTDTKQQKYIDIIRKSSKRLLSTLNDLMDISKLETGQINLNTSAININEELFNLYEFYKPEVVNKGIKLSINLERKNEDLVIESDRPKFDAVVTNLLKNAIKYSNQGNIIFGYSIKNKVIEFFVSDTGIGIPKNRQKAIFDRFVQADIEDKNVYEGSGLGLSISKSYIEMMGGKIWVNSKEGSGSTFYFTLPLIKETIEKPKPQIDNSNLSDLALSKKINVLIAEDDDYAFQYLNIILEGYFNTVYRATTGLQAIKICENHPELDLILMDIKMPIMNGYEATKSIRKFNKNIIIIAQTAYALMGNKEEAHTAGCNEYISKPIKKTKLIKYLKKYFNNK